MDYIAKQKAARAKIAQFGLDAVILDKQAQIGPDGLPVLDPKVGIVYDRFEFPVRVVREQISVIEQAQAQGLIQTGDEIFLLGGGAWPFKKYKAVRNPDPYGFDRYIYELDGEGEGEPKLGAEDEITIGEKHYKIYRAAPTAPGPVTIIYQLYVRGGGDG